VSLYNNDYNNFLEENIFKSLSWLVEEFNFLFKSKNHEYCQYDKTLANQIIACFSRSSDFIYDEKMNEKLKNTVKNLEDLYPTLLKSA
jgi:hypothetical protein